MQQNRVVGELTLDDRGREKVSHKLVSRAWESSTSELV